MKRWGQVRVRVVVGRCGVGLDELLNGPGQQDLGQVGGRGQEKRRGQGEGGGRWLVGGVPARAVCVCVVRHGMVVR